MDIVETKPVTEDLRWVCIKGEWSLDASNATAGALARCDCVQQQRLVARLVKGAACIQGCETRTNT